MKLIFLVVSVFANTATGHKGALKISGMSKICSFNNELKRSAPRAATVLSSYVGVIQRLQNLDGDLQMLVTEDHINGSEWLQIISLAVKTTTAAMIKTLHTNAATAVYAPATGNLFAGRVDDFVGIFKAAIGTTNYCISDGVNAYTHSTQNKLTGCLGNDGKQTSFAETTIDTPINYDTAFKTAMGTSGDLQSADSKNCMLTQHGSNGGTAYAENAQEKDTRWGNGLFKVAASSAATHTDWPHYGKQTIDGTEFSPCKTKMEQLEQALADNPQLATQLLRLETKFPKITGTLQIPKPFFDTNDPEANYDVEEAQLQQLQTALETMRDGSEYKNKRKRKLLTSSKTLISSASKKCPETAAATEAAKKSNTNTQADKGCDSKGKSECNEPCVWKGTDKNGKCEPKEGVKAEGKKEDKYAGKAEDTSTKVPGCKWEDNKCKDSSFLVHKKLALSMAAAFMILVKF
uniref:Variant surface glycoprotein 824 n=1 Tax=Trypanosoma brucei TaxID=5691 RepID=M4T0T2_9TRYP|nr:variant surface glycoprotein 824 [Trypanosoma brucei]